MNCMARKLYTIGYEETDVKTFLDKLSASGVKTLVDVRELAQSRIPGYSKSALAEKLRRHGFEYLHIPELGSPRELRHELRESGNFAAFARGYTIHLKKEIEQIEKLKDMVYNQTCCLLCFEKDHNTCHRKFVADHIKILGRNGLEIVHL